MTLEPGVLELVELSVQATRGQLAPLAAAVDVHHHYVIDDACRRRLAAGRMSGTGSVVVRVGPDLDLGFGQPVVHDPLAADPLHAEVESERPGDTRSLARVQRDLGEQLVL